MQLAMHVRRMVSVVGDNAHCVLILWEANAVLPSCNCPMHGSILLILALLDASLSVKIKFLPSVKTTPSDVGCYE